MKKNKKHQKLDTLLDLREFGRVNHLFAPARVLCHWADTPYCATGRTLRTVPLGGHSVLCQWADTPAYRQKETTISSEGDDVIRRRFTVP